MSYINGSSNMSYIYWIYDLNLACDLTLCMHACREEKSYLQLVFSLFPSLAKRIAVIEQPVREAT